MAWLETVLAFAALIAITIIVFALKDTGYL